MYSESRGVIALARIRFGPAGKPVDFRGPMERVPEFLASMGLDALEYEAVRGVRISEAKARLLGEEARRHGVLLSMHAPYYVNLASPEDDVVRRSLKRLYDSMLAAEWMGAYAVVVYPGYYKGNKSREEALKRVIDSLKSLMDSIPAWVKTPWIAPETMGKSSQVGSLEEVVAICREVPRCRPCVDWAHLYARAEGGFVRSVDEVTKAVEYIERELGREVVSPLHTHFSRIEYGRGGEREHHTLAEEEYGPEWRIVCRAYLELGIDAVVISESPILEKDALVMKRICEEEASKM